jgi:hypothetical protein
LAKVKNLFQVIDKKDNIGNNRLILGLKGRGRGRREHKRSCIFYFFWMSPYSLSGLQVKLYDERSLTDAFFGIPHRDIDYLFNGSSQVWFCGGG